MRRAALFLMLCAAAPAQTLLQQNFDVRTYGSKCDGTTNDAAGIQAAFTKANAAGGGVVSFPAGKTCKIDSSITVYSNTVVQGNLAKITTANVISNLILSGTNITLQDAWLDSTANSVNSTLLALDTNAKHITVRGGKWTGAKAIGFYSIADGVADVLIDGVYASGIGYGVLFNGDGVHGYDLRDVRVVNSRFETVTGDCLAINTPLTSFGKTWYQGAQDVLFDNNYCSIGTPADFSKGFGVSFAGGAYGKVTNNTFVNSYWQALHLEDMTSDIIFSDNVVNGTVGDGASWIDGTSGVWVSNSKNLNISRNEFRNTRDQAIEIVFDASAPTQSFWYSINDNDIIDAGRNGIQIAGWPTNQINVIVSRNRVKGSGRSGLYLTANPQGLVVTENFFSDSARYGIESNTPRLAVWRDNILSGNILGDYLTVSAVGPNFFHDLTAASAGVVAVGATPWQNIGSLGQAASGTLAVTGMYGGGDHYTKVWAIDWDGTTLTQTLKGTDSAAAVLVTGLALQMSGSTLQVRASGAANDITINFNSRFDGVISRR